MRYWRFYLAASFLIVAYQLPHDRRALICLACGLLLIVWGLYHNKQYKKRRAKWIEEHPYYDPNYEYSRFQVENTDVVDEEGDRQAALRRFAQRSDEFEGDILGSLRPLAKDEYGQATAYGVYLNETRVGDVPESEVEFITNHIRYLETFNKIMLTNWEEGCEGPWGLLVSLRFPRNVYETPYAPKDGNLLGSTAGNMLN